MILCNTQLYYHVISENDLIEPNALQSFPRSSIALIHFYVELYISDNRYANGFTEKLQGRRQFIFSSSNQNLTETRSELNRTRNRPILLKLSSFVSEYFLQVFEISFCNLTCSPTSFHLN